MDSRQTEVRNQVARIERMEDCLIRDNQALCERLKALVETTQASHAFMTDLSDWLASYDHWAHQVTYVGGKLPYSTLFNDLDVYEAQNSPMLSTSRRELIQKHLLALQKLIPKGHEEFISHLKYSNISVLH